MTHGIWSANNPYRSRHATNGYGLLLSNNWSRRCFMQRHRQGELIEFRNGTSRKHLAKFK